MKTDNKNQRKRIYRSPSAVKTRERLTVLSKEKIAQRNKEREICMQKNLQMQKDAKDNSGKNPQDELFFKMAESMMLF